MHIFLSWSGERSGKVAEALRQWIPKVLQIVRPWTSSASIDPGARWSVEVGQALSEMNFGILCLTPENLPAPWILFEAGALSKTVSQARVIPYLLGFEARELQGPLSQFQAVQADREGTWQLVSAINGSAGDRSIASDVLAESFDLWWPRLEPVLENAAAAVPEVDAIPARSSEDMLGEVLALLRTQRTPSAAEELMPASRALYEAIPFEPALSVGDRVRKLRTSRGWSQADLASKAGISQAYISGIETGRYYPTRWVLDAVAGALAVAPDELTGAEAR
jgi:DNA-binding XRE family transcriptional regulator